MKYLYRGLALTGLVMLCFSASAVEVDDNSGYAGLKWSFGQKRPHGIVGFRTAKVDDQGDVRGWDIGLTWNFKKRKIVKVMFEGFGGKEYQQGIGGAGYDFETGKPAFRVGIKEPFSKLALDVGPGAKPDLNIGIDSVKEYEKPAQQPPGAVIGTPQ